MKVPEDLRVALEQWTLMDEKVIRPFSRLGDVLRACANAAQRLADTEAAQKTAQAKLDAMEEEYASRREGYERSMQSLAEQQRTAREAWQREQAETNRMLAILQERKAALEAEVGAKAQEAHRVSQAIADLERRQEEIKRHMRQRVEEALQ